MGSGKRAQFFAAIAATALIIIVTMCVAWFAVWPTRPAVEKFDNNDWNRSGPPTALQLYASDISGRPDVAATDSSTVTLFSSGVSLPAVVLQMTSVNDPMFVTSVINNLVTIAPAYNIILAGAFVYSAFSLHPTQTTGTFVYSGSAAQTYLQSIEHMRNSGPVPGWKLVLSTPASVISAHNIVPLMGNAGAPVVPGISKFANIGGFTMKLLTNAASSTLVIAIFPQNGRPPASITISVGSGALSVTYASLPGVSAVPDVMNAARSSVSTAPPGNSVTLADPLFNPLFNQAGLTIVGEFVRGCVRVCSSRGMSKVALFCAVPGMLNDASVLATDPVNPPSVSVATSGVDTGAVVLPFAIGDLGVL